MHAKEAGSVRELVRHHPRALAIVLGFTAGGSLIFYTFTTYMQKYLVNTAGMNAKVASNVMTVALFIYMLLQPVFGIISDRIGRKNSMLCFTSLSVLATVSLLTALGNVTSPYAALTLILAALTIISFYTSISGVVKAELFPTEVRALGVGLSYAIANALFGGTAEYVALWFKSVGHENFFPWYVTVLLLLGFAASVAMPDTRKHGYLEGDGQVEKPRR